MRSKEKTEKKSILAILICVFLLFGSLPSFAFANTNTNEVRKNDVFKYTISNEGAIITGLNNMTLTEIFVPDEIDGKKVIAIGDMAFAGCSSVENIVLNEGLIEIGEFAFAGCNLTEITLPDTVTSLGTQAFACESLSNLTLSEKLTELPELMLSDYDSLKTLIIPSKVTKLSYMSLGTGMETLYIPKSVTIIEGDCFTNSLKDIYYAGSEDDWDKISIDQNNKLDDVTIHYSDFSYAISEDGISITGINDTSLTNINIPETIAGKEVMAISDFAFAGCESVTKISLPNTLKTIGLFSFANCSIKEITIPDSVTSIAASAFSGCRSLENIVLSNNITKLSDYTFISCAALKSITIPEGVTEIGISAFSETSLEDMYVPKSVVTIGDHVVDSIDNVYYAGTKTEWDNISIGSDNTALSKANMIYGYDGTEDVHVWDNDFTIDKEPTCVEEGSKSIHCSECDATKDVTVIEKKAHEYSEWIVDSNATCTEKGSEYQECNNCHGIKMNEIPALDHDYIEHEGKAPSCVKGWNPYETCNRCAYSTYEELEPIYEHSYGEWTHINVATETIDGLYKRTCGACGNEDVYNYGFSCIPYKVENGFIYLDGSTGSIIDCDDNVTKAIIPSKIDEISVVNISCEAFMGCEKLSVVKIPDSVTYIDEVAFNSCNGLMRIEIPSSVSSIGDMVFAGCDNLVIYGTSGSSAEAYAERYGIFFVDGSWSDDIELKDISLCDISDMSKQTVNGSGIDLKVTIKDGDSLLKEDKDYLLTYEDIDGQNIAKIIGIGEYTGVVNKPFELFIPTLADADKITNSQWEWIYYKLCRAAVNKSKFTEDESADPGMIFWYIWNCGDFEKYRVEYSVEYSYEISFEEYTDLADKYFMSYDDAILKEWLKNFFAIEYNDTEDKFTISPAWGGGPTKASLNKVEKIENGYILRGTYIGENTDFGDMQFLVKKTPEGYKIAAYGKCIHSWDAEFTVDKEATCTEEGSKSIHCTECDATKEATVIKKIDHEYGEWTIDKDPTCTEVGSKHKMCSCGDKVIKEISVIAHTWKEAATVDKEATCSEEGSMSIHCSVCDEKKDVTEIKKLPHVYSDWIIDMESSCIETGRKHKECTCGDTVIEEIALQAHVTINGQCIECNNVLDYDAIKTITAMQQEFDALDDLCTIVECVVVYDYSDKVEQYKEDIETYKAYIDEKIDSYEYKFINLSYYNTAEIERMYKDYTSDISDLKRKIEALSWDNSSSASAKRRQLQAQLAEVEAEYQLFMKDWSTLKSINALKNEYESYKEQKTKELKEIKEILNNDEKLAQVVFEVMNTTDQEKLKRQCLDLTNDPNFNMSKSLITEIVDEGMEVLGDYNIEPYVLYDYLFNKINDHESEGHLWKAATCTEQKICCLCELVEGDVLGHDIQTIYNNDRTHVEHCTRCDYTKNNSCMFDGGVITKEPTKSTDGIKTFTCTVCGGSYTEIIKYVVPINENVSRIYGADRYATSIKSANVLKDDMGVSKFDNIIIASGKTFADALPGSYLAAQKDAPILLISAGNISTVTDYINNNIKPGGTVYILGGTAVIPSSWTSGMSNVTIKRLGGENRYETNLLILKEAGVSNGSDILVCTGTNFADSLSASATGKPILLVGKSLKSNQKAYLNNLSGETYYMIGGTSAVSNSVMKECKAYGGVDRIAGADRYATSVAVANMFFGKPDYAVLAYAKNFPDGLSAGPLAYNMKSPLILTATGKEKAAIDYARNKGIKYGYVLGGAGLISDKSVKTIFQMKSSDVIKTK